MSDPTVAATAESVSIGEAGSGTRDADFRSRATVTWSPQTLDEARRAVWSERDWEGGIAHCLPHLTSMPEDGTLLDLGCGVGRLAIPMARSRPDATVLAVDTSPEMIRYLEQTPDLPPNLVPLCVTYDGVGTLDGIGRLGGAWSVLTFQHLSGNDQWYYLLDLSHHLPPGAPLVLQHVTDCEAGPLSNPVPEAHMRYWWQVNGLEIVSYETDDRFPTWRWVKGRKR